MINLKVRDSDELASHCKRSVFLDRAEACQLGQEALEIGSRGVYNVNDRSIKIVDDVYLANSGTKSYPPDSTLPAEGRERDPERTTTVEVANLTTLAAAKEIRFSRHRVAVLNFANPIQPGGGFLTGARAQEESLCRSSTLYHSIRSDKMYEWHLSRSDSRLASNWCIWSPNVPVFRNDMGDLLERWWGVSVVTCAAPQAAYTTRKHVRELMTRRIPRVLDVFRTHGATHIVLGAWGSGAFGCRPDDVAEIFAEALRGPFDGVFDHVTFAIADWSEHRRNLGPFVRAFQDASPEQVG